MKVENLDHLGIVTGLIDEIGIVELLNEMLGTDPREKVSIGIAVKAMLLNGLGFVSAPLYLFEQFFRGKATEKLLGEGIKAENLNDDRLGKALDKLYEAGINSTNFKLSKNLTMVRQENRLKMISPNVLPIVLRLLLSPLNLTLRLNVFVVVALFWPPMFLTQTN